MFILKWCGSPLLLDSLGDVKAVSEKAEVGLFPGQELPLWFGNWPQASSEMQPGVLPPG